MARPAALAMMLVASAEGARVAKHRNPGLQNCGAKGASPTVNISIVNGQPAAECAWRWQVGLSNSPDFGPWCGGMLITPEWVLTAAHCLAGETRINVVAGEHKITETSGMEQNRWSERIILHPQYDSRTMDNDIGLIKLASPVEMNDCVGTVCLPEADVTPGSSCWITGWGTLRSGGSSPTTLQEAQVDVLSNDDCKKTRYSSSAIMDSMLCAQGTNKNGKITDACQGDSGGPLVCQSGDSWTVYGATSWGFGCAWSGYPGIWARVHEFVDWIDDTMAEKVESQATLPISINDCGGSRHLVSLSAYQPKSVRTGTTTTVMTSGTLSEDVSGGTMNIRVKLTGFPWTGLGEIKNGNFCNKLKLDLRTAGIYGGTVEWQGIDCPIRAGKLSAGIKLTLPGYLPTWLMNVRAELNGTTSTGKPLLCSTTTTSR